MVVRSRAINHIVIVGSVGYLLKEVIHFIQHIRLTWFK